MGHLHDFKWIHNFYFYLSSKDKSYKFSEHTWKIGAAYLLYVPNTVYKYY
jgi:hypothetical protein